jgi:hypothetical protein
VNEAAQDDHGFVLPGSMRFRRCWVSLHLACAFELLPSSQSPPYVWFRCIRLDKIKSENLQFKLTSIPVLKDKKNAQEPYDKPMGKRLFHASFLGWIDRVRVSGCGCEGVLRW